MKEYSLQSMETWATQWFDSYFDMMDYLSSSPGGTWIIVINHGEEEE